MTDRCDVIPSLVRTVSNVSINMSTTVRSLTSKAMFLALSQYRCAPSEGVSQTLVLHDMVIVVVTYGLDFRVVLREKLVLGV